MMYYRITCGIDAVFQQVFLRNRIYVFTEPWQMAADKLEIQIGRTMRGLDRGVHTPSQSPFSSHSASSLAELR